MMIDVAIRTHYPCIGVHAPLVVDIYSHRMQLLLAMYRHRWAAAAGTADTVY